MNATTYQTDLDEVIALLNAEMVRLFGEPMDEEQTEAVFDEEQVFEMVDDFEARMGLDVTAARALIVAFYA